MNSGNVSDIENLKSEIVIIGGGGSGLSAAVAAAENGAKVIVLEKRRVPGGNSVFPEGLFAAESPAQKRMMIDASRDDLFKIAMDFSHWKINPRIIRAFIDKSGNTIQWLEEKGLRSKRVLRLKEKDNSGYIEQPLKMELVGNFNSFYSFMLELEQLSRIMKIRELEIKKDLTNDGDIYADFVVSIFFQQKA